MCVEKQSSSLSRNSAHNASGAAINGTMLGGGLSTVNGSGSRPHARMRMDLSVSADRILCESYCETSTAATVVHMFAIETSFGTSSAIPVLNDSDS